MKKLYAVHPGSRDAISSEDLKKGGSREHKLYAVEIEQFESFMQADLLVYQNGGSPEDWCMISAAYPRAAIEIAQNFGFNQKPGSPYKPYAPSYLTFGPIG